MQRRCSKTSTELNLNIMSSRVPEVVVVGGGFGGLASAKVLKKASARVTLIDRDNHHLFQPLLYQVATSILTPGQIDPPFVKFSANRKM
ncbi:MAG: FAD-dependent oxidoreductase [Limisphaerales bacterium]